MLRVLLCILGLFSLAPDPGTESQAALREASLQRRAAFGKKGEEKHDLLTRAAATYQEVAQQHADDRPVSAEAWFRAGEILRSLRQVEDARRCFQAAAAITEVPSFGARALNEQAHLERRLKNFEGALALYEQVEQRFPAERLQCARALTWQGKVLLKMKQVEEGHTRLLAVRDRYAEFPVEAIRNVDLVAASWIRAGRVPEARSLIDQCLEQYGTPAAGAEEVEPDVRRALDRMKSPDLLGDGTSS